MIADTAASTSPPRGGRRAFQRSDLRTLLVAGDAIVATLAVSIALALWTITAGAIAWPVFLRAHAWWFLAVPIWLVLLADAYDARVALSLAQVARVLIRAVVVLLAGYMVLYFYLPRRVLPRLMTLYFVWEALLLTFAWRLTYVFLFMRARLARHVAIVGTGKPAMTALELVQTFARDLHVVALVAESAALDGSMVAGVPVVAGPARLRELTASGVDELVLALERAPSRTLLEELVEQQQSGVDVIGMPLLYEQILARVPIDHLEPAWIFTTFADAVRAKDASPLAKRLVDVAGAAIGLALLIVALPIVATAIWIESGRPIFFRQVRVGRGGRPFTILKFRTMIRDAEADGPRYAQRDDPRVTRVGRWLRRVRLDELPQCWNVLRGDMSLVGPRPERPEFVARLERAVPFYRTRLIVRPGLTGWAQINHPYADSEADAAVKLEYDLYYIKHRSLVFDWSIVVRTVGALARFPGT